jgi:hypothetical protein
MELNEADKKLLLLAIGVYRIKKGELKELNNNPAVRAIFLEIKAQIDKEIIAYENGMKGKKYGTSGGRPKPQNKKHAIT